LEDRAVPALVVGSNLNVSGLGSSDQHDIMAAVNPVNPLNVVAISETGTQGMDVALWYSMDGGNSFNRVDITSAIDGQSPVNFFDAFYRHDPTVAFDAQGRLYVAYGVTDITGFSGQIGVLGTTRLMLLRSDDGGASFALAQMVVEGLSDLTSADGPVSSGNPPSGQPDNPIESGVWTHLPGMQEFRLATGLDPVSGRQAVYAAFTWNLDVDSPRGTGLALSQHIYVIGSNDFGATFNPLNFGFPLKINDDPIPANAAQSRSNASIAVGNSGELYVVWNDLDDSAIRIDRDLDGLFTPGQTPAPLGTDMIVISPQDNLYRDSIPAHPSRGVFTNPVVAVNRLTTSPFYGNVFVSYTDEAVDGLPNTDVRLAVSNNTGLPGSWTYSNVASTSGSEFHAWLDIDQVTGSAYLLYYTSAADVLLGNDDVHAQLAVTSDGGATFTAANVTTTTAGTLRPTINASLRGEADQFGKYIGLAAFNGVIHAFWSDNRLNPPADLELFTATVLDTASGGSGLGGNLSAPGVFRNGQFVVDLNANRMFDAGIDLVYTFGQAGDIPIVGDWDGDGVTNIGVFRAGQWFLDANGNNVWDGPFIDYAFSFGLAGDRPVAGDWNGDGKDDIGVFRDGIWALDINSDRQWTPLLGDVSFRYGSPGDQPAVGNWNLDGRDEVGVFRSGRWYFDANSNRASDPADTTILFGLAGDTAVPGTWSSVSSGSTPAIFRAAAWFADTSGNRAWDGLAFDIAFVYGLHTDLPVAGIWAGTAPLLAGSAPTNPMAGSVVTYADLDPIVNRALALWLATGLDADLAERLGAVQVQIGNLSGSLLGLTTANTIVIDADAGGFGWFIDSTPDGNEEFAATADGLFAASGAAAGKMDLLTAIAHELGHAIGLVDLDHDAAHRDVMAGSLNIGERRLPAVDLLFASDELDELLGK
jgi:hypothetical protein